MSQERTQHTPLPWTQSGVYITGIDNEQAIAKTIEMKASNLAEDVERKRALAVANAALIVRAVNAHEWLLEIARMYLHDLEIQAQPDEDGYVPAPDSLYYVKLDKVKAAIRNAEGGK